MTTESQPSHDIGVHVDAGTHVATLELRRAPNNHFDTELIRALADAAERLAAEGTARAIVLCAAGKHFCAGRDFTRARGEADSAEELYAHAVRLVAAPLPIVAAVQGAAIGGGLGLAMVADHRIAGPGARFSANFARLGIHQGFGLTVTLPRVIGYQYASKLLLTGRRIDGTEAARIGLVDHLVDRGEERSAATELAAEIAASAPLAVRAIRATLRGDLAERFRAATAHEGEQQRWLRETADHREGSPRPRSAGPPGSRAAEAATLTTGSR